MKEYADLAQIWLWRQPDGLKFVTCDVMANVWFYHGEEMVDSVLSDLFVDQEGSGVFAKKILDEFYRHNSPIAEMLVKLGQQNIFTEENLEMVLESSPHIPEGAYEGFPAIVEYKYDSGSDEIEITKITPLRREDIARMIKTIGR